VGVLLTTGAIVTAITVGVWSERRWPRGAVAASRRALTLVLYVLIPPVVFFNLAATEIDLDHGIGLVLGLLSVSLAALLAWWIASRVLGLPRHKTGAVVCTVLAINSAYLGYPLTIALLGRDELSTAVLYDILVCAPSLLLGAFAIGAAFGTSAGETPRERVRAFFTRNPPLYAAAAGLLAPAALAPDIAVDISQALVVAMLPLGFFAVGATLAENAEHGELPMPPPLTRPVAVAVACRLIVAPGLLILFAARLVDLPDSYLLLAAMPTGINSMIVAHAYGLDMEITAEAVTWSTGIVILAALASLLI
jgi:malate permease and related proteins